MSQVSHQAVGSVANATSVREIAGAFVIGSALLVIDGRVSTLWRR